MKKFVDRRREVNAALAAQDRANRCHRCHAPLGSALRHTVYDWHKVRICCSKECADDCLADAMAARS